MENIAQGCVNQWKSIVNSNKIRASHHITTSARSLAVVTREGSQKSWPCIILSQNRRAYLPAPARLVGLTILLRVRFRSATTLQMPSRADSTCPGSPGGSRQQRRSQMACPWKLLSMKRAVQSKVKLSNLYFEIFALKLQKSSSESVIRWKSEMSGTTKILTITDYVPNNDPVFIAQLGCKVQQMINDTVL